MTIPCNLIIDIAHSLTTSSTLTSRKYLHKMRYTSAISWWTARDGGQILSSPIKRGHWGLRF